MFGPKTYLKTLAPTVRQGYFLQITRNLAPTSFLKSPKYNFLPLLKISKSNPQKDDSHDSHNSIFSIDKIAAFGMLSRQLPIKKKKCCA
jgi:D-mannonate dehydratase